MQQIAIIGLNKQIKEKVIPLMDGKRIKVKYIGWGNVNLLLLKLVDILYIDDRLDREYKENAFHYCFANNIKLLLFSSEIIVTMNHKYKKLGNMLVFSFNNLKWNRLFRFLKRCIDLFLSLIMIIILLPLMTIIYLMIKLSDGGPAIYRQKRVTKDEREFVLLKFRTMINKAEHEVGVTLSTINDQRITKLGKFLRKRRLDELPQLFNVLIGDMSLVGPRPERKYFVDKYKTQSDFYKYRHLVKAGITGLAQVNCRYNAHFLDKLSFDLLYISRYWPLKDFVILFQTLRACLTSSLTEGIGNNFTGAIKAKGLGAVNITPNLIELRSINEKNNIELQ